MSAIVRGLNGLKLGFFQANRRPQKEAIKKGEYINNPLDGLRRVPASPFSNGVCRTAALPG